MPFQSGGRDLAADPHRHPSVGQHNRDVADLTNAYRVYGKLVRGEVQDLCNACRGSDFQLYLNDMDLRGARCLASRACRCC